MKLTTKKKAIYMNLVDCTIDLIKSNICSHKN